MYSQKVLDHFKNPRNMGIIKKPDGFAQVGNPVCGDVMKIYIKVAKKGGEDIISDIKFQTLGCAAAIATTSALTELAKGKTIKEALKIDRQAIADYLGGLPPIKMHCSVLSQEVLKKAVKNWESHKKSKK